MLEPQTLRFLTGLQTHNNKDWFESHRAAYEAARIDFLNFFQLVIEALQKVDTTIAGSSSRDCSYRINRDVRFSGDKTPYKRHFSAYLCRGGKKSGNAGYYFHLEPGGGSSVGGGLWMPEAPRLKAVRQEIDYGWEEWSGIVKGKAFRNTFGDLYRGEDQSLKTVPKGYEADNPSIADLKLKSFIAEKKISDEELTTAKLHRTTVDAFKAIMPMIHFLNRPVEGEGT